MKDGKHSLRSDFRMGYDEHILGSVEGIGKGIPVTTHGNGNHQDYVISFQTYRFY